LVDVDVRFWENGQFRCRSKSLSVSILRSKEEFGIDCIAPQRIGPLRGFASSRNRCEYALDIDSKGQSSNPRVTQWYAGSESTKQGLLDFVSQKCFIPVRVNEKSITMPYFAVTNGLKFYHRMIR